MKTQIILSALFATVLANYASFAAPNPDGDMKKVLDELSAKKGKPIELLSAKEARKQPSSADAVLALLDKEKKRDTIAVPAEIKDIQIDGAAGKIAARIYKPKGNSPMPVVVYYHGGGFVIGSIESYDSTPRSLSVLSNAIFVSVEYRKAPEHKFPAAHDDAFAAYKWVLKNAGSFGGDPRRIAVAGESAGGNLALNVAIKARDERIQIPVYELLIYPVAGTDMNTESYKKNADAKPLSKPMMEWFIDKYIRTPADAKDPRLNLLAADVNGLAPATIITAELDPLRSEGKALAQKMKRVGVEVDYQNYDGVTHEFFGMGSVVKDAKKAEKAASSDLKEAFRF